MPTSILWKITLYYRAEPVRTHYVFDRAIADLVATSIRSEYPYSGVGNEYYSIILLPTLDYDISEVSDYLVYPQGKEE